MVSAVEYVEDAVREHERAWKCSEPRGKRIGGADLALKGKGNLANVHKAAIMSWWSLYQSKNSKRRTTLRTPLVNLAISTASLASCFFTRPIR